MEIGLKLKGAPEEMQLLFDNFNIRFYEAVGENTYKVVVRVSEDFKKRAFKTIKGLTRSLYLQDQYFNEENIKEIVAYIR